MKKLLCLVLCLCLAAALGAPAALAEESEPEAADVIGLKEDNVYRSEFLGIQAEFDENWYLLSDEEALEAMGQVANSVENGDLADLLRESGAVCDLFAVALDGSRDTINIQLENLGFLYGMVLSEEAYLKQAQGMLEESLKQMGLENIRIQSETIDFAGEEHLSIAIVGEMSGVEIYERMVLLKEGSYMASVTYASVGSRNADRLPELFSAIDADEVKEAA